MRLASFRSPHDPLRRTTVENREKDPGTRQPGVLAQSSDWLISYYARRLIARVIFLLLEEQG